MHRLCGAGGCGNFARVTLKFISLRSMGKNSLFPKSAVWVLVALALVVLLPVALRPKGERERHADETLVIITPHNEAIRYEFTRAFSEDYFKQTGRTVTIDWRTPGGGSEIGRYLASEYLGSFQNYWQKQLQRPWNAEVQGAFDNPKVKPGDDTLAAQARKAFLESSVGCGVDLFFGGGSFEFNQQANAGRLVDAGLFSNSAVPLVWLGERLRDPNGRWAGAALSAFGICYNVDALKRIGFNETPERWQDLADPRFFRHIALSDPTSSGSAAKAFEMLVQEQIALAGGDAQLEEGWANGMRLIQKIAANARYFTDSASKVPWDVESGDAAAGMAIDFYGRFQSESVRKADGTSRMGYITPKGGSSFGADPIGLLRGAPSPELAKKFIQFVLSEEGQKLWNWKKDTPGGPTKYALRRLHILPSAYTSETEEFRSDPGVFPYGSDGMTYHSAWTGALFRTLSFVVKTMCIDTHDELQEAWGALVSAGFPPEATALFEDVSAVSYTVALKELQPALSSAKKIDQVRLAAQLSEHFRKQYLRVTELAKAGK
jgi:iron(III) transport system substrate-binding protein